MYSHGCGSNSRREIEMLINKAFGEIFYHVGKFYQVCLLALLVLTLNSSIAFANNFNQIENTANLDNKLTSSLKYALNNSSLPLIDEVTRLYETRDFNLIWSDGLQYNNKAYELHRVIQNARKLGLNPADYDLDIIEYFLDTTAADPAILSKSDVTFTHAYIKLASHIKTDNFDTADGLYNSYSLLDDKIEKDTQRSARKSSQGNKTLINGYLMR